MKKGCYYVTRFDAKKVISAARAEVEPINYFTRVAVLAGNTNWRGRLSTVELLIKVAYFVKEANNILNIKK